MENYIEYATELAQSVLNAHLSSTDLKNTDMSTYKLSSILKVYYELNFVSSNILNKVGRIPCQPCKVWLRSLLNVMEVVEKLPRG